MSGRNYLLRIAVRLADQVRRAETAERSRDQWEHNHADVVFRYREHQKVTARIIAELRARVLELEIREPIYHHLISASVSVAIRQPAAYEETQAGADRWAAFYQALNEALDLLPHLP
jgi:hypothetical protein